jgi:hypothetical protein
MTSKGDQSLALGGFFFYSFPVQIQYQGINRKPALSNVIWKEEKFN